MAIRKLIKCQVFLPARAVIEIDALSVFEEVSTSEIIRRYVLAGLAADRAVRVSANSATTVVAPPDASREPVETLPDPEPPPDEEALIAEREEALRVRRAALHADTDV